jgi:hypothetical protein
MPPLLEANDDASERPMGRGWWGVLDDAMMMELEKKSSSG